MECLDHFNEKAEAWHLLYNRSEFKDRLHLFTYYLKKKVPVPAQVLDFGCGSGSMAIQLAKNGYDVLGLDASENMIRSARDSQRRQQVHNARFQVCGANSHCAGNEKFDAVVCSSVIEYLDKDAELIMMLADSLKHKGVLLVSAPHKGSLLGKIENLGLNRFIDIGRDKKRDRDFCKRLYDKNKFVELLQSFGLIVSEVTFFDFPLSGAPGITLSRLSFLGRMMIAVSEKNGPRSH